MLTSTNQYLRPEYLTPLPTTLDAKKSPLALLAQTCSQIGADASNLKTLQSVEKINRTTKCDLDKDRLLHATENVQNSDLKSESSFQEMSSSVESFNNSSTTCSANTPLISTDSPHGRCSSSQSVNSTNISPVPSENKASQENNAELSNLSDKANHGSIYHTPTQCSPKTSFMSNILTPSDPNIKDVPLGTFKTPLQSSTPPFLSGYCSGFSLPADVMTNNLITPNHTIKSGVISSYLGYGRVKEPVSSVCRDPYCAGCVTSHLFSASTTGKTLSCPAGCVQCDHAKPSISGGYLNQNSTSTVYAHAQLASLTAVSHLPYICNWISGDATYCGKRFSNSEELLSHLRTHTSAIVSESNSTLSILSSTVLPPTHSLLPRLYPTPPLSPLTTARYHPYSKPSLIYTPLSSPSINNFTVNHPSISPYLSSYSLYGPRIGTIPGMLP